MEKDQPGEISRPAVSTASMMPARRHIKLKKRNQILSGLTAQHIDPVEALESLQSIHDTHINNVKVTQEVTQHYIEKTCEICSKLDDEASMLLCDRCDDAYHNFCLSPPIKEIPQREWMCLQCLRDISEAVCRSSETKTEQKDCSSCGKVLALPETIRCWKEGNFETPVELVVKSNGRQACKYCQRLYHTECLNPRKNALNCAQCEKALRRQIPRGQEQFIRFMELLHAQDTNFTSTFDILPKKTSCQWGSEMVGRLGLQPPKRPQNVYVLIKVTASLSYALMTQRMRFFDDQIYPKGITSPAMNRVPDKSNIRRLHPSDEQAFEKLKEISRKGFYGALEVSESKTKGFYVKAICEIPARTLLCEYVGEVLSSRHSLSETSNECIFSLLNTSHSRTSLDICPTRYGNLSKFVCGINNLHGRRKLNVQSLRFLYQGHVRVVFFAKRTIKAEETLYVDYNAGGFHEYPTQHFDVE